MSRGVTIGTPTPIAQYLAGLAARLRGPVRARADLLGEARDSLLDAAEAYQAAGLPAQRAARRAVAEFGTYAEVAPAYQAELAVAQGRRTARLIAVGLPLVHLLAPLMWWHSPWSGQPPSQGYYALVAGFDVLVLVGGLGAALALLGFGRAGRYLPDGPVLATVLGRGALAFLAVHGAAGATIFAWSAWQWPEAVTWPPMLIGAVVAGTGFLVTLRSVLACRGAAAQTAAVGPTAAAADGGRYRPAGRVARG